MILSLQLTPVCDSTLVDFSINQNPNMIFYYVDAQNTDPCFKMFFLSRTQSYSRQIISLKTNRLYKYLTNWVNVVLNGKYTVRHIPLHIKRLPIYYPNLICDNCPK